jgi:uncharacterized protein (DUF849 family)
MNKREVVVTCAVTGSIHTPSMSPHLPVTAYRATPRNRRPDQSPERFKPFLEIIKQRSNCAVNITTGGAANMTETSASATCVLETKLKAWLRWRGRVSLWRGGPDHALHRCLRR